MHDVGMEGVDGQRLTRADVWQAGEPCGRESRVSAVFRAWVEMGTEGREGGHA